MYIYIYTSLSLSRSLSIYIYIYKYILYIIYTHNIMPCDTLVSLFSWSALVGAGQPSEGKLLVSS